MSAFSFVSSLREFLQSLPRNFNFPLGGPSVIPSTPEQNLLTALEGNPQIDPAELALFRQHLNVRDAYSLVTFAVRMAVWAVRSESPQRLRAGLFTVVIDDGTVDWRDILRALAILEDCSARLGLNFKTEIGQRLDLATDRRRRLISESYLSRQPAMRSPAAMGFRADGSGESFCYVHES
jgi:hypothetical protein